MSKLVQNEKSGLEVDFGGLSLAENASKNSVTSSCESSRVTVTVVDSLETLSLFQATSNGKAVLAVDGEGVDLSRLGLLTVLSVGIQVSMGVHVFLFDIIHSNSELRAAQNVILRAILEDELVEKVIHDCRQDSDALSVQLGIRLTNVFDSSVFISEIETSSRKTNLNKALELYSCPLNKNRDAISNMYKTKPDFWKARPLTPFMVEYASCDVASLFELREKLLTKVTQRPSLVLSVIRNASEAAILEFRDLPYHEVIRVPQSKKGCVIGRGGSGITSIERRTGARLACNDKDGFLVLAPSKGVLELARAAIKSSYY